MDVFDKISPPSISLLIDEEYKYPGYLILLLFKFNKYPGSEMVLNKSKLVYSLFNVSFNLKLNIGYLYTYFNGLSGVSKLYFISS